MNKTEMVDVVAREGEISASLSKTIVNGLLAAMAEALEDDETVDLRGIGKISVVHKEERKGRNPRTGESITIPAKRVLKFKASQTISKALND